jgi:L-ascorbate metabolism protein UlaG (beta-lactamase superfamily)
LIDAWIENNLACCPNWPPNCVNSGVDIIMLTHGDTDHCVDTSALYHDTQAQVVCQYDAVEWLTYQDVANESIVALNKGGTARINDVRITMVNAQHSNSWPTSVGPRMFGSEVGYVLRVDNDITVYAAGDTNVMPDMAIIADLYHPDVAMIPIGDVFTIGPVRSRICDATAQVCSSVAHSP